MGRSFRIYDNGGFNKFGRGNVGKRPFFPAPLPVRYNLSARANGAVRFSPPPRGRNTQTT